jgi:hypothetical protein
MAAKRKPKADKEQARRFAEAARKIGADESGEAFERAFKRIVPAKRPAAVTEKPRRRADHE